MNAPSATGDEEILVAAYHEEMNHYRVALGKAENLLRVLREGGDGACATQELADALGAISGIEAQIAEARRRWHLCGQQPGPELSTALNETAELVQSLIVYLDHAQHLGMKTQSQLLPQVAALAQNRLMQRAYGNYGRTSQRK